MFPVGRHSSYNFMHVFKNSFVSCFMFTLQDIYTYVEIKLRETTANFNLNKVGLGKVKNTLKFVGQKT
jgi:hypothetical protein